MKGNQVKSSIKIQIKLNTWLKNWLCMHKKSKIGLNWNSYVKDITINSF